MTFGTEIYRLLDVGTLSHMQVLVAVNGVLAELERAELERIAAVAIAAGCDAAWTRAEMERQAQRLLAARPARLEQARREISAPPPTAH